MKSTKKFRLTSFFALKHAQIIEKKIIQMNFHILLLFTHDQTTYHLPNIKFNQPESSFNYTFIKIINKMTKYY